MYTYTKQKGPKAKKRMLFALTGTLVLLVGVMSFSYMDSLSKKPEDLPVVADHDTPVIKLPAKSEKAIRPYNVNATLVLDYYDGNTGEVDSISEFEGTYRGNQGCDYSFENQEFDVVSILSGEVSEVKEDPLFGHTIKIKTGDIVITYQSMKDIIHKQGDQVKQGDILGKASTNIYNKDLGNHVHIVVDKSGVMIDPENVFDKKVNDIN